MVIVSVKLFLMVNEIWIVLTIIVLAIIAFSFELFRSDLVAIMIMSLLIFTGILSPEEAILGFSNPATLTVACMFILSAALVKGGLVDFVGSLIFSNKKLNLSLSIFFIMLLVGVTSAFINNTAAVAVFIPIVIKMADVSGASRKQLLMPLSFAAIFGGTCTLIGTSTNILVNSIYIKNGFKGFSMFEFSKIGILLAAIGIIYMLTIGKKILGKNATPSFRTKTQEYLTQVELLENSPSVGTILKESPFYIDFKDNIVSMRRDSETRLDENSQLQNGDRFSLICSIEKILSLKDRIGISILDNNPDSTKLLKDLEVYEIVVPSNSDLVGKPLSRSGLIRARGIIPLAVRHLQKTIFTFLRGSHIQPGDVLVVAAKPEAFENFISDERLPVLTNVKTPRVDWFRISFTSIAIFLLISLSSIGIISILGGAIITCALLLITRTLSLQDAYEALDAQVLILLGCILSLGLALEKTGGAALIAQFLVSHAGTLGPIFMVSALYLLTSLMTEVMSNNATAALMAPIALNVAVTMNLNEKPFLIAIMLAGSASFMTPVGYQTNTLIFAPGGFRFTDFMKVGVPINLIFWLTATLLIPYFFPFN